MENRFENLYGYVQRSLMKNIRKELGDDESLTMGILIFYSYSESFYYESTVKNTLLFPSEVLKFFKEKEIWDMELMFYLGKYFSRKKTKSYIKELMEENDVLIKKNASYFAIAYDDYSKFKTSWLDWIDLLPEELFINKYDRANELLKLILNQLFHFANYLLTIIKFPAYREGFQPITGSFREHIYRAVINNLVNSNPGYIKRNTGELPPNKEGYMWSRQTEKDSLLKYSDLAFALEICFKQPLSIKDKITNIKAIIDEIDSNSEPIKLAAMAKPLFYNGEFQGIIYITKNTAKGNFSKKDFDNFKKTISDFHIEDIIYSSRFETARIYLEKISAIDLRLAHPFIKILSCQHIFSSSPLGFLMINGTSNFVRIREDSVMQTRKINIGFQSISTFLRNELDFNFQEQLSQSHYVWFDIPDNKSQKFNIKLAEKFETKEELNIKSFIVLKFLFENSPVYYFLFNSNHIETIRSESNFNIKQVYALRALNNVNKLYDVFLRSKNLVDIQNNLLNEIQLGVIHEQKTFLKTKILSSLDVIESSSSKREIKKITTQIRIDAKNAIDRFGDFLKVLSEQSNEGEKSSITKNELIDVCQKIKTKFKSKTIEIKIDLNLLKEYNEVKSYLYTISFILDELVSNAIKQYATPEGELISIKYIEMKVNPIYSSDGNFGFSFEVFNTGSNIPLTISNVAGIEQISNGSNNSSGYGFYLINKLLKRIKAPSLQNDKYFEIINKPEGVLIKFNVFNK